MNFSVYFTWASFAKNRPVSHGDAYEIPGGFEPSEFTNRGVQFGEQFQRATASLVRADCI